MLSLRASIPFALVLGFCVSASLASAQDPSEKQKPDPNAPAKIQDVNEATESAKTDGVRSGDTAWMMASTALVMFMVPGLALFYGGMVRRKNVLATMMQSMICLSLVGVYWIGIGYCLAFGPTRGGWYGWHNDLLFLQGIQPDMYLPNTNIPIYLHALYQGMFAIITPALISGALAERIRFGPFCFFVLLWMTFVYCPLAHWVWAMDWWQVADNGTLGLGTGKKAVGILGGDTLGFLGTGALDFAGGTVVHIAAGFSGLAAILVLRKRLGYPQQAIQPFSMVLTVLGAGMLWFGWFGFNGGSALGSGTLSVSAFAATQAAAAAAGLSWVAVEWIHRGKPTGLGLASGIVAGLVAVTPASGFVYITGGLIIGALGGAICYLAVMLKSSFKYDDSLDAFGVHGVGGFLGAVLTGVFCWNAVNSAATDGLTAGGGTGQLVSQVLASAVAAVLAFGVSLILVKLVDVVCGFTTDAESETIGLDRSEHNEVGVDIGPAMEYTASAEPRAAKLPRDGVKHFTIAVDGVGGEDLMHAWSEMCQPDAPKTPPEFKAVYPYITTVQGRRFHFRGGEPAAMKDHLQRLFQSRFKNVQAKVE